MSPIAKFFLLICVFGVVYVNAWPSSKPAAQANDDEERLQMFDGPSPYLTGVTCKEDEELMPGKVPTCEPTCDNPRPDCLRIYYNSLDYVPCFCKAPLVRDLSSKKCVLLKDCPAKN